MDRKIVVPAGVTSAVLLMADVAIARLQLPQGTGMIRPSILLSRIDGDAPRAQDD